MRASVRTLCFAGWRCAYPAYMRQERLPVQLPVIRNHAAVRTIPSSSETIGLYPSSFSPRNIQRKIKVELRHTVMRQRRLFRRFAAKTLHAAGNHVQHWVGNGTDPAVDFNSSISLCTMLRRVQGSPLVMLYARPDTSLSHSGWLASHMA